MEIVKKYLTNGQYLSTEDEKRSVILHHTVSLNADSAWRWWNTTPERVGTQYIIDRDGTIIECFDPKFWAFHLGVVGDDNWHESHSVAIEIVAAGFLHKEDDKFLFYPLWPNKFRPVVIPKEEVAELKTEFRGFKYFHKYSEAQIKSLIWLLGHIKETFPTVVLDNDLTDFGKFDPTIVKDHIPGIWCHSCFREDKTDLYPDTDLIKALKDFQKSLVPSTNVNPKSPKSK